MSQPSKPHGEAEVTGIPTQPTADDGGIHARLTAHVELDQPMVTTSRGFSMEPPGWQVKTKTVFSSDGRSFDVVLLVKPDVDYSVSLNRFGSGFMSASGYPVLPYKQEVKSKISGN